MKMIKVKNGNAHFWVKDPKKIKYWRKLALLSSQGPFGETGGTVRILKEVKE